LPQQTSGFFIKVALPRNVPVVSVGGADLNVPTAQASAPNETPGAKDLDKYKWGALTVMIAWLLIVLFGKTLIRRKA
jgi:hypothetical protein